MATSPSKPTTDLLDAIASGGKAGGDAYKAAANTLTSDRANALASATGRAQAINAPQTFVNNTQAAIASPLDAAIKSLQTRSAGEGAYRGSMDSAANNAISSINAEAPLVTQQATTKANKEYGKDYSSAISQALSQLSQLNSLKKTADTANQTAAQQSIYQDMLGGPSTKYSAPTQQAAKQLYQAIQNGATESEIQKELSKDANGNDLTADDWAQKGVNLQDLQNFVNSQLNPTKYFKSHPSNPKFYSPPGTPGGADLANG